MEVAMRQNNTGRDRNWRRNAAVEVAFVDFSSAQPRRMTLFLDEIGAIHNFDCRRSFTEAALNLVLGAAYLISSHPLHMGIGLANNYVFQAPFLLAALAVVANCGKFVEHALLSITHSQRNNNNKLEDMSHLLSPLLLLLLLLSSGPKMYECARVFTIINYCKETVWPGITSGENFRIKIRPIHCFPSPGWVDWSYMGSNRLQFTLSAVDYYDVSLFDGFNLPISIKPIHGQGNCRTYGCESDPRESCPGELAVKGGGNGKTIGCRTACDVFNTDQYCCRVTYGNPVTCQPTFYSKKFKEACPTAYSYAYDDPTSIFTCAGTDYVVSFCSARHKFFGMEFLQTLSNLLVGLGKAIHFRPTSLFYAWNAFRKLLMKQWRRGLGNLFVFQGMV
ncbi:Thaumatin-like protein 1 [Hibiscus syriacus]|uniref:Thaumatin-like protein 1 n=1 Tax=Hibiscus syriacus TaxID=106335 RepID=A0A6A3BJX4_HIBSY|nr:Thaumatin-like protein 1 [Hibiscus syriacus]